MTKWKQSKTGLLSFGHKLLQFSIRLFYTIIKTTCEKGHRKAWKYMPRVKLCIMHMKSLKRTLEGPLPSRAAVQFACWPPSDVSVGVRRSGSACDNCVWRRPRPVLAIPALWQPLQNGRSFGSPAQGAAEPAPNHHRRPAHDQGRTMGRGGTCNAAPPFM